MSAVERQRHMGIGLAVYRHVKDLLAVLLPEIFRGAVGRVIESKGEHGTAQILQRRHGPGVVRVGHHPPAVRHQLRKPAERVLNILQILEKIQMVGLHVQNHRHRGIKRQEGIAVFTRFQDDGIALSHPIAGVEHGQCTSDHNRGVRLRRHEDVGAHGGGGGLSVGTGDAKGVGIAAHDGSQCLRPLIDRNPPSHRAGNLRVVVMDGGGTDHEIAIPQIFRAMPNIHMDSQGLQMLHRIALMDIGPMDHKAHSLQDFGQRAHGHAADSHQMDPLAGNHVSADRL